MREGWLKKSPFDLLDYNSLKWLKKMIDKNRAT